MINDILSQKMKIGKLERLVANLHEKNWICYTRKKFKTSIKS